MDSALKRPTDDDIPTPPSLIRTLSDHERCPVTRKPRMFRRQRRKAHKKNLAGARTRLRAADAACFVLLPGSSTSTAHEGKSERLMNEGGSVARCVFAAARARVSVVRLSVSSCQLCAPVRPTNKLSGEFFFLNCKPGARLALGLALDFRPRDRQPWHLAEHPRRKRLVGT
eukprot:scaffold7194_cov113-Isochrysis_galbana.AAC.1